MHERLAEAVSIGREVGRLAIERRVSMLAAAVAFYAAFSLVPLALIGVAVATALGGQPVAERLLSSTAGSLTPTGEELVLEALTTPAGRTGATITGTLALGWGAMKGVRGLDQAFATVYGTADDGGWFRGIVDAAIAIGLLGIAGAGVFAAGAAVALLPSAPVAGLGWLALVVALTAVFLPLFWFLPDLPVGVREALPGAAFAATSWTALGAGFGVYTQYAAGFALYGVLGGVLLLLMWLYVGATVLVLGVALNAVLGDGGVGDRQLQHAGGPFSVAMDERPDGSGDTDREPGSVEELRSEVMTLRDDLAAFRADVEERTVARAAVESDLRRYVRRRLRRGHARGWGPYLVLLYGTVMTIGAFYLLSGGWAILAMVVVWLSTLGLYVVMVLAGAALGALGAPGHIADAVRERRERD